MPTMLELYDRTNRINDVKGNTPILRKRNNINKEFEYLLDTSPNVFTDIVVTHVDGTTDLITMVIDDLVELDVLKQDDKRIMTDSDLVVNGDLISWQGIDYVTFIEDAITVADYYKFRIRPCNTRLKWVLEDGSISGNGLGVPCAARNQTLYSLGVNDSYYLMSTPSAKMSVDIPNTPEVQSIKRGDKFIIAGDVFYAAMTDRVSYDGILHMLLGQDELNEQTEEDGINDGTLINTEIFIVNVDSNVDLLLGNTLQLEINTLFNGDITTNPKIEYSSSDGLIATIDSNGLITSVSLGTCTITANSPAANSYESFTLNVVNVVSDNYNAFIFGDENIKVYETKQYQGKFYNNGIEVIDSGTWLLTNTDDSPTTFASLDINLDECSVTANNNKNEQVKLKYSLDINPAINFEKIISIKPIY